MRAAAGQATPISAAEAVTLDGVFRERVARTPETVAYRDYNQQHANWRDYTWAQIDRQVARWQTALERDGLKAGDRVAVMLRNSPEWVIFDQAALGLGLIVVPLYTQDRCDNVAYILNDAGCKVLLLGTNEQWKAFALCAISSAVSCAYSRWRRNRRPPTSRASNRSNNGCRTTVARRVISRAIRACWPPLSTRRAPPAGPRA